MNASLLVQDSSWCVLGGVAGVADGVSVAFQLSSHPSLFLLYLNPADLMLTVTQTTDETSS